MGGADGTVHIKSDPLGRLCMVHRVNPLAGEICQRCTIVGRGKNVGLKPGHLTGRCSLAINGTPADDLAYHRIMGKPVRIVYIRIFRQSPEGGLAQQADKVVNPVLASPRVP